MFLSRRFYLAMMAVILMMAGGYLWLPLFTIGRWMLLALLLVLAADVLLLYGGGTLAATRQCSDRFSNGDANTVTIAVTSTYRIPVAVTIVDEAPVAFQQRNNALPLGPSATVQYQLTPTRRGLYSFGYIRLFAKTRIAWVERRFTSGQPQDVKVYPSYQRLHQYEFLAIHHNLTEQGLKRLRRVGHHTEFEQIKDYVVGDDYRTMNWRATARRHALMVNVYSQERSQQVYCVIDKGRAMQQAFAIGHEGSATGGPSMTLLDYSINASLALSFVAIRKEDQAGLLTFSDQAFVRLGGSAQEDHLPGGATFLPASRRQGQMQTLMEVLYAQQTHFGESDFSGLAVNLERLITRRSLLILFTSFPTLVALRRQMPFLEQINRRHRLLVVFFEDTETQSLPGTNLSEQARLVRQVVAGKFLSEQRHMVSVLKQHGIASLLTAPQNLSVSVINKYIELKDQSL